MKTLILVLICAAALIALQLFSTPRSAASQSAATVTPSHRQLIVWTSSDPEIARKVVFLYAENCAKLKWMDHVRLLVWGPSQTLLLNDPQLQAQLKDLKTAGVDLWACRACADLYGYTDRLAALGLNVTPSGEMFVETQKAGWHLLTF